MLVGYAGTGRAGQPLEIQLRALSDAGCAKVFSEAQNWMSVGATNALQRALDFVREGDTLMVAELDCIVRSVIDIRDNIARLADRGVEFRCLPQSRMTTNTDAKSPVMPVPDAVTESGRTFDDRAHGRG